MNEVDPQFGRRFDADENAQTLPPDDEEVEIRSVWISEIYGPSEFDDLVRALTDLGWESTPRFGAGSPPGEWLRAARQGTRPGATYPINLIGPKPSYGACMFQADLPDDIQSVNGAFWHRLDPDTFAWLVFEVRS